MLIIPAIDLRDGKCVRLIQGDYSRQINYEDNPVKQAEQFVAAGAEWLHVVDLDGAKEGRPINTKKIADLAAIGKLRIEVGGGIRTEQAIKQLLDLGIERVIIGTKAVEDFAWFGQMAEKFPNRLALGLDARGSKVATRGWTVDNSKGLLDFAEDAAKLPIAAIIYTDITKDGMMTGPNFKRTKTLIDAVKVPVVASGGVTKVAEIRKLAGIGAAAAIIGRALYEGKLSLADAIAAGKQTQ
jgi:phosphoribosylformimino-5-aminoimidazole carboxamide ribotide isomerase